MRKKSAFASLFVAVLAVAEDAHSAPFYYNPKSFAIYANSLDWNDGASRKFEGLFDCKRTANTRRESYHDYESQAVLDIQRKISKNRESIDTYSSWISAAESKIRLYQSQQAELRAQMSELDPTYRAWHWGEFEVVTRTNPKYQHLVDRYSTLRDNIRQLEASIERYSGRKENLIREIQRLERSIDEASVQYKNVSLPDSYRCNGGYITTISPKGKQVCDLSFLEWDGVTEASSFNLYRSTCVNRNTLFDWLLPVGDPPKEIRSLPMPFDKDLAPLTR